MSTAVNVLRPLDEKKANHQVNIIRVAEVLKHPNADLLEIIIVSGYQVVVKKGDFAPGDLGVYIQPDSIVPQTEPFKFIWEGYVDPLNPDIQVPERRRRITVRKFRGEWSEGLLLPVSYFYDLYAEVGQLYPGVVEGTDVSDLLGITHYDPDAGKEVESTRGVNEAGPGSVRKYPKSLKGWFYWLLHKLGFNPNGNVYGYDREKGLSVPVYDVDALKNHLNAFIPGEMVSVTEKIHGSNARYCFFKGKMYVGSRTLWKSPKSTCIWRKALEANPWIEEWCKAHEGYVLYGEVTPTQKSKNYTYNYGSDDPQFFVFDIMKPDRTWASVGETAELDIAGTIRWVPIVYYGPFDLESIKKVVDGPSTVPGANHIREGVVIKAVMDRHVVGLGRLQLKLVSNVFLDKDTK